MRLSKHKKKPSYDFPEEMLSEILKRLPVKYVLRCGAVQKSWYSLIKTPMFISLHFNHQKMTAHMNPKYLLFNNTSTHELTVRFDDSQCQEYCTFDCPLDLPACSWHTQSNGLICMSNMFGREPDYNPDIYLWNPLVQKYKTVPDSARSTISFKEINWNAIAFGFLPEVNDYVVVHIVKPRSASEPESFSFMDLDSHLIYEQYPHSVMIGVYSVNTNSWKEIRQDKVLVDYMCTNHSVFVNGTAFWVGCDSFFQLVMYFDTKTNVLGKIRVPSYMACYERQLENPLILPFGQSISYFVEVDEYDLKEDNVEDPEEQDDNYGTPHLEIWALRDDLRDHMIGQSDWWSDWWGGGGLSWEKKMSVSLSENVWADVLGIRNNGEPIQAKSNKLISYDLDTHEPYDFVESCDHLTPSYNEEGSKSPFVIRPFVETLVFLDID